MGSFVFFREQKVGKGELTDEKTATTTEVSGLASYEKYTPLYDKWDYNTRVYQKDAKTGVAIVGSVINYKDGDKWGRLDNVYLGFPDGITTTEKETKILDKPSWGTFVLAKDKQSVDLVDTAGVTIQTYKDLAGVKANYVDNSSTPELKAQNTVNASFDVGTSGELKVVLPQKPLEAVKLYDAVNTTSTDIKDSSMYKYTKTNNYGSSVWLDNDDRSTYTMRSIISYTLPATNYGTITDLKLWFTKDNNSPGGEVMTLEAHYCTQTAWVEAQVTWNIWKTSNNWVTGGGDFNATVLGSTSTFPAIGGLLYIDVYDAAVAWNTTSSYLLKAAAENQTNYHAVYLGSKESPTTTWRPYFEIDYTVPVSAVTTKVIQTNEE